MKGLFVAVLFTLSASQVQAEDAVYCRDGNNERVDWWVMYKFPANDVTYVNVQRGFNTNGIQFAYFDSNTDNLAYWKMFPETLYSSKIPLAYTLKSLFATKRSKIAYAAYNDQPYEEENVKPKNEKKHPKEYAHSKGILMADANTGVWLLHSVPQFPIAVHTGEYNMTRTARKNGQYFMCVTVGEKEVDVIAELLITQKVVVNHEYFPPSLTSKYPYLRALTKGKGVEPKHQVEIKPIKSKNNAKFTAVAKPVTWINDIYTHVVTNLTKSDIFVQSWRRPEFGWLYPVCNLTYSVKDVEKLRFQFNSSSYLEYSYRQDHSKFAVAVDKPWFCFSSLNRGSTQFRRGGELLCRENGDIADLFRRTVVEVTPCNAIQPPNKPPRRPGGGTTATKRPWNTPWSKPSEKPTKTTKKPRAPRPERSTTRRTKSATSKRTRRPSMKLTKHEKKEKINTKTIF